jgi:hypothetical protein
LPSCLAPVPRIVAEARAVSPTPSTVGLTSTDSDGFDGPGVGAGDGDAGVSAEGVVDDVLPLLLPQAAANAHTSSIAIDCRLKTRIV